MGRDITVHHIEELCDRRLRIYHKTHGGSGGGDTPETDSKSYCVLQDAVRINGNYMFPLVYVTNDPYNEDDYEQNEQSRFANLFDIQSQTPDRYRVNTGIQKLITTPTTETFGVITPIKFTPYANIGEALWTFSRGTADECLSELVYDDVVQFIHSDDIRYDISDVILISLNKDIIFIRDVNVAGFMTSDVTVDGVDAVKYTNFPLAGTDYQHILAKFNFFKNANPDLPYDNSGWQLLCSTVQFDIDSMKEATKRDNVYEVI